MTEERDLLKANLTEMTKEMERLQSLFNQNRKHCTDQGADLVVIDSPKEQSFIASFTKKRTWIGLNDIEQEGTWKWVDGTPLTLQ
ncbi:CD209 antigen-like protein A [Oreochromis niloticus]|uniref:CD209 antigen-like protein A n=1 Tax=Oreochromis niloticus TaxID=8128 RepID=UPI000904E215|nr:CD209 antigen-like protein A [Oreochromis niloticus]